MPISLQEGVCWSEAPLHCTKGPYMAKPCSPVLMLKWGPKKSQKLIILAKMALFCIIDHLWLFLAILSFNYVIRPLIFGERSYE